MPVVKKLTYSEAGVDRKLRAESKKALKILERTYEFSSPGQIVQLPYGNILPCGNDRYLDLTIEGIGTKVLVAQLMRKHDTIGIDGVAVAVNDIIRSGAKPLAIADNIHSQVSDPALVKEWLKGIADGAVQAECVVPGGEIGDVAELIKGAVEGEGFDMVVAAVGGVSRDKIIDGKHVRPEDPIIGLRSSGVHSNGISLVRKVLFKQWGGKYEPDEIPVELDREVGCEVLEPTRIYVKPLLKVADELEIKAAVHVTGDAYLKFGRIARFSEGIGFEFDNFKPQPVFDLIQRAASELGGMITDEEMLKTFNMGWGFAIIVSREDRDRALDVLNRTRVQAEQIGHVTDGEGVRVIYKGRKIALK